MHPWTARLGVVLAVLAVAFPLAGLWILNAQFSIDWHNHSWFAAYTGEYLRQHGALPVVLNTDELAGMPVEVFYGGLFYSLLALLTTLFTPQFVLRLVAVACMALQFRLISQALVEQNVSPWTARASAALVAWATYPLTNLYHRGAITEFVATILLTCAVALWYSTVQAPTAQARGRRALAFGLVVALMAATHPITAIFSVPFLTALPVLALVEHRRDRAFCLSLAKQLVLPGVLAVVVLGPWLYAIARYQPLLQISGTLVDVWFYPGIDSWAARFALLPTDPRTAHTPLAALSTPYLDAQFNLALPLLVLGWLAVIVARRRGLRLASLGAVAPYVAVAVLFALMSEDPKTYEYLPKSARLIQIGYRAITYQNLAWLLALFGLVALLRRRGAGEPAQAPVVLVVAALALSAAGVVVKLQHVAKTRTLVPASEPLVVASAEVRRRWAHLPPESYGMVAYTTPSLYQPLGPAERAIVRAVTIPIGTDKFFGKPQPVRLDTLSEAWFTTNVQAFPWNHLVIDGAVVPRAELRMDDYRLSVHVGPGTHTLKLRTVADRAWIALRFVSFLATLGWVAWLIIAGARAALVEAATKRRTARRQLREGSGVSVRRLA